MLKTVLITVISLGCVNTKAPAQSPGIDASQIIEKAAVALGGKTSVEHLKGIRVSWYGNTDLSAVYQGMHAMKPFTARRLESLIIDQVDNKFVFREESSNEDGMTFLSQVIMDSVTGISMNVKTNHNRKMSVPESKYLKENYRWRIPFFIISSLLARPNDLSQEVKTKMFFGKLCYSIHCKLENETIITLLIDKKTFLPAGMLYNLDFFEREATVSYVFGKYIPNTSFGWFPDGYRVYVGDRLYRNMAVIDARLISSIETAWFTNLPKTESGNRPAAPGLTVEKINRSFCLVRNFNGFNIGIADVGNQQIAILDAPMETPFNPPLPKKNVGTDWRKTIDSIVKSEFPGYEIKYIIPTHHHLDHLKAVRYFNEKKYTVVTTESNKSVVKAIAGDANILFVGDSLVIGNPPGQIVIYHLKPGFHCADMLFIYFPDAHIGYEADVTDYVPVSKQFKLYLETHHIPIKKIYGTHCSTQTFFEELDYDIPVN